MLKEKIKKSLVHSKSFSKKYDKIIFAIHSDDILNLLQKASEEEKKYFQNINMKKIILLFIKIKDLCQIIKMYGHLGMY